VIEECFYRSRPRSEDKFGCAAHLGGTFGAVARRTKSRDFFDFPIMSFAALPDNHSIVELSSETKERCEETSRTGRFSPDERKILVSLIWDDAEVLSAFCHQQRKQNIRGKSFMHLITDRFNQRTNQKRSHDAVRHHLKLRRSNLGPLMNKGQNVSPTLRDFRMLEKLLEHRWVCSSHNACTRCLQMHRLRVQRGLACCDFAPCQSCDKSLPSVRDPFDAREVLLEIRRRFYGKAAMDDQLEERKHQQLMEYSQVHRRQNCNRKNHLYETSQKSENSGSGKNGELLGDNCFDLRVPMHANIPGQSSTAAPNQYFGAGYHSSSLDAALNELKAFDFDPESPQQTSTSQALARLLRIGPGENPYEDKQYYSSLQRENDASAFTEALNAFTSPLGSISSPKSGGSGDENVHRQLPATFLASDISCSHETVNRPHESLQVDVALTFPDLSATVNASSFSQSRKRSHASNGSDEIDEEERRLAKSPRLPFP